MQATAKLKYLRASPQKTRLVVDLIRGIPASKALEYLRASGKRAATHVEKTLNSAIANAESSGNVDVDELVVREAYVGEGPRLKRLRAAPMGRAFHYQHRLCHIVITVSDGKESD